MARIELNSEESEELATILEEIRSDLRMEIVDTEDQKFREGLKTRGRLLDKIISQLRKS